jgi:hypothetical protein
MERISLYIGMKHGGETGRPRTEDALTHILVRENGVWEHTVLTSGRDEQKWPDLKESEGRRTSRCEPLLWKETKPDGF